MLSSLSDTLPTSLPRPAGRALRNGAGLLLAAALAACGSAVQNAPVAAAPPSHSVEQAQQRLDAAARERAAVEAEFAAAERVCYTRFFVNRCLDAAKEKRRAALERIRIVEVEAAHYKREASVAERDRALAEAAQQAEQEQARRAAEPPKPAHEPAAPPAPSKQLPAERAAEHAARLKRLEAQERAGAPQRAANARAYEKRRLESQQRQRDIEAKKAQAEQERAAKERAAPAQADQKP